MMIPPNLLYARTHEWVKLEGETAVIGITDYAQHELGDITFIGLPKVGQGLRQGAGAAEIESAKAAADIYAPVSGQVSEVNERLNNDPGLINTDPYGAGWMVKIILADRGELDKLMNAQQYAQAAKEKGER
jgi:glycine cleavage system H protein